MYLSDYQETCLQYDMTGDRLLWMGRLINYQSKVDAVRLCPAANVTNSIKRTYGAADKAWYCDSLKPAKRWTGSYCLNGWLYSGLVERYGAMPAADQNKVFEKGSHVLKPRKPRSLPWASGLQLAPDKRSAPGQPVSRLHRKRPRFKGSPGTNDDRPPRQFSRQQRTRQL